jgi:hypothetical protein
MRKKESIVKEWINEDVFHLLKNAGKIYTQELKRMAIEDVDMLNLLVKIFLTDEKKLSWHAGWVLFKLAETHTELLEKHVPSIIRKLPNMLYSQQAHAALRIIKNYDIKDEDLQGILVDTGIKFILENKYPPNLKYFSIVIIEKIAKYYPELKNELVLTIEEALPHWTTNYIVKFGKKKLLEY